MLPPFAMISLPNSWPNETASSFRPVILDFITKVPSNLAIAPYNVRLLVWFIYALDEIGERHDPSKNFKKLLSARVS